MVVFVLSGCASEASALPNIEATVEAKITELTAPNTPVPAPTLIIIITEVIKEVEVPVIVEVEVIKEIEANYWSILFLKRLKITGRIFCSKWSRNRDSSPKFS